MIDTVLIRSKGEMIVCALNWIESDRELGEYFRP